MQLIDRMLWWSNLVALLGGALLLALALVGAGAAWLIGVWL